MDAWASLACALRRLAGAAMLGSLVLAPFAESSAGSIAGSVSGSVTGSVTGPAPERPPADLSQIDPIPYVDSNTLAIFYHELGHALIDVMNLPVLGQEETAADVLSVLLFDYIFVEDDAEAIARDVAASFLLAAAEPDSEPAFWDVHGLDLQRFFTLVCLHYGAFPERRSGFRKDMKLPDERAEGCAQERALADDSWGVFLDEISSGEAGSAKLTFRKAVEPETEAQATMVETLETEVREWNAFAGLPGAVTVVFDRCDEINAFYTPDDRTITMCAEYADYLAGQVER